jgi:hypothetical protein
LGISFANDFHNLGYIVVGVGEPSGASGGIGGGNIDKTVRPDETLSPLWR